MSQFNNQNPFEVYNEENNVVVAPQQDSKIVKNWSLLAFCSHFVDMGVGEFTNKETGEKFKTCVFTKPDGDLLYVGIAQKLGDIDENFIAQQYADLQVVENDKGYYTLCKKGSTNIKKVVLPMGTFIKE